MEVFGNLNFSISKKQKELSELLLSNKPKVQSIENFRNELAELLHRKEIMWKQRAKDHYIKEGDRNTKYFHMVASKRRRNNLILRVEDELRVWCEEP